MKRKAILVLGLLFFLLLIAYGGFLISQPSPLALQGQVEAKVVDIAAKVPGRVLRILVREGDQVLTGDLLFELESPELTAKLSQVTSARDAALAMQRKASNGAREEEVRAAKFAWARAESSAELSNKTYLRFHSLYQEGLISQQKNDEVATNVKAANDAASALKAQYDMAVNGARLEDKNAAAALVSQAEGMVDEISAYRAETRLRAPLDAQVSEILIEAGELVPTGFPVVTLVDLDDSWVVLNLREDHLAKFKMHSKVTGIVPSLNDLEVTLSVFYIAPLADFATWHATRYSTGYDIKTFEVRLRTDKTIDGLRPGMSVLIDSVYDNGSNK